MNGGRDGCSVLWKMANFFFSISMDWLQTWDQKPKISNIALSCRLSFDAISTYILAYSLQRMYHGWAQVRQKNCSSWSDEHISLSIVIHLSSWFFLVYIYIYTIIDIAIHLFVFVGVYIYNYIYIIVIAIYCYLHISVLWLFYVVYIHVRVKYVYRILYVCKIRRRRRRRKVVEEYTPVDGKANQLALNRPTYVYPLIWHRSSFWIRLGYRCCIIQTHQIIQVVCIDMCKRNYTWYVWLRVYIYIYICWMGAWGTGFYDAPITRSKGAQGPPFTFSEGFIEGQR